MEPIPNNYSEKTDNEIFTLTKEELKKRFYFADGYMFKFDSFRINKTKASGLRLRCDKSNSSCRCAIVLTRFGCIEWLTNQPHSQGNAKYAIPEHNKESHIEDSDPIIPKVEDLEPVTIKEIDILIKVKNYTRERIFDELGERVPKIYKPKVSSIIRKRIDYWNGKMSKENCLKICPKIKLNNRFSYDFCRSEIKTVIDGRIHTGIIFASRPQLKLFEFTDLVVIDGFFKLKVKRFKQLFTFCVFLNSVYIPVAHLLLSDKTSLTYIQAFQQLKSLIWYDTNNQVDWSKKVFLSDRENALEVAVNTVFSPTFHNKCYFHYVKALYDNFSFKMPPHLWSSSKALINVLKLKPFLCNFERRLPCSTEGLICATFHLLYQDNPDVLPFIFLRIY